MIEGYSPYAKIAELLDPHSVGSNKDKWGFVTRLVNVSKATKEGRFKLFKKDGWAVGRRAKHGITLTKAFPNRTRVTFVPDTSVSLPEGTLHDILSTDQTGISKRGLLHLVNKYGI